MIDNKDTIIVLGAGASKDCGAPLINEFLPKAFSEEVMQELTDQEQFIFSVVKNFWETTLPNSNIEELFSLVSFHLNFPVVMGVFNSEKILSRLNLKEQLNRFNTHSVSSNQDYLQSIFDNLNLLISKTLHITLKNNNEKKRRARNAYLNLLKKYNGSTIITFNWDILLEQAFKEVTGKSDVPLENFGFYKETNLPLILKLHGSLNWLFCDKCKQIYVYNEKMHHLSGEVCPKCGIKRKNTKLKQFKILPVIEKLSAIKEYGENIQNIWGHARTSIVNAKKIIVVGYSFSQGDLHSQLFFKKNIIDNSVLKEIIFVNPNKDSSFERRTIDLLGMENPFKKYDVIIRNQLKYKSVIIREPNKRIEVKYVYKTFSEFFGLCPLPNGNITQNT